jgi:hypothetical protein
LIAPTDRATELRILSFAARVVGPPETIEQLGRVYREAPKWTSVTPGSELSEFRVERRSAGDYGLSVYATEVAVGAELQDVASMLDSVLLSWATSSLAKRYLLFHAGSAARNGTGVLLPASTHGGKTTLVAGLVASGWSYFGDELAVVDPDSLHLMPVNRSMCLRSGSRDALLARYPDLAAVEACRRYGNEAVWFLSPPSAAIPTEPAPVRFVVVPSYQQGAETALSPITRSTALQALLEQSSRGAAGNRQRIAAVVAMVRQAECFALTSGDLDKAIALLDELVAAD